jgi:hypothetical protein
MPPLSRNTFPHISHLNDFTPLCIWIWHFRLHLYENTLEHILHVKALSIAWLLQYEFVNDFFTDSTCRSVCSFLLLEEPLLHIRSISFSDIPATVFWSRCSVVLPVYWWVVKMCWLWKNKQYYFTQLFILSTKLQSVCHTPQDYSLKSIILLYVAMYNSMEHTVCFHHLHISKLYLSCHFLGQNSELSDNWIWY